MRLNPKPFVVLLAVATLMACKPNQEEEKPAVSSTEMTEQDKTLYALGALMSRNLLAFEFTEQELEIVKRGLSDSVAKKTLAVKPEEYQDKISALHETRMAAAGKRDSEAGKAYVEKAAAE